jgi:hypothetical protein
VEILEKIAQIGRGHPSAPTLQDVEIFKPFLSNGAVTDPDKAEGKYTRRELVTRFLLLGAVLDQGPDMGGIRKLLANTINNLYKKDIKILHDPLSFFKEIAIVADEIDKVHAEIKEIEEENWRKNNNTTKSYNLFMDGTTQTISYAVFRWGVPLGIILALSNSSGSPTPLIDFLEEDTKDFPSSAENMSQKIKDHKKYGIGKAIGNKAAHLFAKWFVHTFHLSRKTDNAWGGFSFELPFDSNAGRVLWRTGELLRFVTRAELENKNVIQTGGGKGGTNYLRITNCRGIKITKTAEVDFEKYKELCTECLKVAKNAPRTIELQRAPAAILFKDKKFNVGELDDGLMHIGTKYCFNHDAPKCDECPLRDDCKGHTQCPDLIKEYRT